MTLGTILSWLLCGLIVGLIARLLVPGRQPMGILLTIVLGIIGAIVGGYIYSLIMGPPGDPWTFRGDAWHGWIVSILGAVVVLLIVQAVSPRRRW
jgi:uncharacterized membrane protein YeaQ/YmgE (transglycosylase-associated protein family)